MATFAKKSFRCLVQRKHSIARLFHSAIQRYSSAVFQTNFQCYFSSEPLASTFRGAKIQGRSMPRVFAREICSGVDHCGARSGAVVTMVALS